MLLQSCIGLGLRASMAGASCILLVTLLPVALFRGSMCGSLNLGRVPYYFGELNWDIQGPPSLENYP